MNQPDFVPALGRPEFTRDYDRVVALMTREKKWRSALLAATAPKPGETVVDFGCGTGSMAIQMKRAEPQARLIGIDPDQTVLNIAIGKAKVADVAVDWVLGMGDRASGLVGPGVADAVISSLVLHQCPLPMKRHMLRDMFVVAKAGGRLCIADYGLQRTALMQLLFRQVRLVDGFENTKPNKDGMLPDLIAQAGFEEVSELTVVQTPTGSISLYGGRKPA